MIIVSVNRTAGAARATTARRPRTLGLVLTTVGAGFAVTAIGVLVELVRDGSVIATDVTDVAGTYSFENLAAGDYVVRIPQSQPVEVPGVNVNALKGLALTSLGGVTDVDNDSNGSTVTDYYVSHTVTLGGSVSTFETESDEEVNRNGGDDDLGWTGGTDTRSDFTVDFGFFNGLRLGDLVWFDTNDNGVRDAGELPVPGGVPVYLYDEDPTGASAAPIATTLTNSQGVYVFTGLDEFTTYWVAIPGSEIESGALVGWRAKPHAGLIDLDRLGHYAPSDFWEPVEARDGRIVLDPGAFYILVSRESVAIPPDYAAEMAPYLAMVGEFRVHYAGFFDPGFGHGTAGQGARGVLEVRCHEAPFALEHGQTVGRLVYERMSARPERLYGQDIASNYQGQGLKLAKQFRGA